MRLDGAKPEDAPGMAAVHAASFNETWGAREIGALLQGPGGFGLVVRAPDSGVILALVLARAVADEAEVLTLAVDPAHRRSGLARALVEAAAVEAAAAGARSLFLEVARDNGAALALYRAVGFSQVGLRPSYYRRGAEAADALVLRRDLNSPPA